MGISASAVKELRDRTGAGMMDCKNALSDSAGDVEKALEILRTRGQAKADKRAGRIATEGRIEIAIAAGGSPAVIMEVNCETDFVARNENFLQFARAAAELALAAQPGSVAALMHLATPSGQTLESKRTDLVAKIGEKIAVRRFELMSSAGETASYVHGSRIGVIADVSGGDEDLRRDLAMHIAAASPQWVSMEDVPEEILQRERRILAEQASQEGKAPEIVAKMVEGRLRKFLAEITLTGQPFVKDPETTVGKLLKSRAAGVRRFVRMQVGEGVENDAT